MILFVFGEGHGYPPPNEEERLALDVGKVRLHPAGVKHGHPQALKESPANSVAAMAARHLSYDRLIPPLETSQAASVFMAYLEAKFIVFEGEHRRMSSN